MRRSLTAAVTLLIALSGQITPGWAGQPLRWVSETEATPACLLADPHDDNVATPIVACPERDTSTQTAATQG